MKKHPSYSFYNYSFCVLLMLLISSCGGSTSTDTSSDSNLFSEAESKIFKDISKIIEDLPPPAEIPTAMQSIGATYDETLPNDLEKLDSYLLEPDKAALNLGVYASDIGYLIAYDQVQESIDHMTACQQLAENLGVSTAFNIEMIQKYEAAMDDHEKLILLLNETIKQAEARLGESDQLTNAGLVLTGSFIEGLYLAVKVIKEHHNEHRRDSNEDEILEPLVRMVMDQEQPLIDIIALLRDIPQEPIITKMIAELNILKLLYDGDLAEIEARLEENPEMVITEEMLFDISLEVIRIRKSITS
ncbi:MAG: hypothetical protein ACJAZM_001795 [Cyclobacteriaceae bacterium]|jgi:hypothetical protein